MWSLLFGDDNESTSSEDVQPLETAKATQLDLTEEASKTSATVPAVPAVVKHRMPSPVRQAGDGMEEDRSSKTLKSDHRSTSASDLKGQIRLPMTNISLDKLPPITDDKVILPDASPSTPLVKMTLSQPHRNERVFGHFHKSKEPKFVPYEPYKAAITPLVVSKKKNKSLNNVRRRSETPDKLDRSVEEVHESTREDLKSRKISVFHSTSVDEELLANPEPAKEVQPVSIESFAEPGPVVETEAEVDLKKLLQEKEAEIAKLRKDWSEAEKQLRIQTQVNSEVKKLLVASVGEDIEAKVDYLTQDKARLAADIRQFSYQISKDFEEKEKLSVQSDVWKSKFLACSVIVDELARWKGALIQNHDDTEHYVRLLFHERNVLWNSLTETQQILDRLRSAFDPLGVVSSPSSTTPKLAEAASVLGMADLNVSVARELQERLLGETKLKSHPDSTPKFRLLDTPAEEGLREVLSVSVEAPPGYSDLASIAVTGAAKPHLMKLGDKLATPSTSFKCCTHCQGTVQIV